MSPKLLNILLILVPAVLYYGYLDPMYNGTPGLFWTPEAGIFTLKSQNVQYADAIAQLSLVQSEIEKINKDYLAVSDEAKKKATMLLPDHIDVIKLRNEIVSIANKSGVAITGLQVRETCKGVTDKVLGCYYVSFAVRSHYSVLKNLIQSYEKSMRLFVFDAASIKHVEKKETNDPSSSEADPEMLESSLGFRVYYLK